MPANAKTSVALSSIAASVGLTLIKLVVGLLTGSIGILSEAAHSLLDVAAAVMTYFAVKHGDKPSDERHHYGHGKIESVSALAETALLFVTSLGIVYEAVRRLLNRDVTVTATWYAFAVIIVSIAVDFSRARALTKVAKASGSQALEADALHFSSDIWSSTVVLLGLACVALGVNGADAIAAIGVAVFVSVAGWRLGQRTLDVLLDTAPHGVADEVRAIAKQTPGVVGVEQVRARPLGATFAVEITVQLNRKLPLAKAQEIIKQVEAAVERHFPGAEVVVRPKSIQLDSETIIETVQVLAAKNGVAVHDVIVDILDGRQYVSYDLEVPDDLTIKEAHDLATDFEEAIRAEIDRDLEINSHIEPLKQEAILSSNVSAAEMKRVLAVIAATDEDVPEINEIHRILVRKIGEKYFVSLHCRAPGDLLIETVHHAASRFEYLMRDKMPDIKRVVIHVEPKK